VRRAGLGVLSGLLLAAGVCRAAPITEGQLTDRKGGKLRFLSGIVSRSTPGHSIDIDVVISGAKKLYLVVGDGNDNYGCDHVAWIEPRLVGPAGEKKLTDLRWSSAICG